MIPKTAPRNAALKEPYKIAARIMGMSVKVMLKGPSLMLPRIS